MKRKYVTNLPRIFRLYSLNLYKWSKSNSEITTDLNYSFERITSENLKLISDISNEKICNFQKMLSWGDYGVFIFVNGKPVGYGWAKCKESRDYFFNIGEVCYLCRFYINSDFRGHNLYPMTIKHLIEQFSKQYNDIYIAVDPANIPSIRGVMKLNFEFVSVLRFMRFLKITFRKFKLEK